MASRHIQNLEIANILKQLEDDTTREEIELRLIVEEIGNRLNRRQSSILYLILIGSSQTEISKLLGYSISTICLEIKKIRKIVTKLYKEEFEITLNNKV